MKFFYKLEGKYGKYAIRNLMYYIMIMYGIGVIVLSQFPEVYYQMLSLDMSKILQGQVWRLVTFMIYPPSLSIYFVLFLLYTYYLLGTTLERVWGSFRFNVYFFIGIIGHWLAALVGYLIFHEIWILTTTFLNFSLFMAYAVQFPDEHFLLMFVIPIKAKYLALAEGAIYLYLFVFGSVQDRCEILLALANLLIFFLLTRDYKKIGNRIDPRELKRKRTFQKQVKIKPCGNTHHKCAVCGRTELDDETLEFRYCSKCEGSYEYCSEHLYTHQHVISSQDDKVNHG